MIHVVLFEPEIPPNTGNIIRLCANTGTYLHLVQPLGFALDDTRLQRAGLDYHELANVREHESLEKCLSSMNSANVYAISTRGETIYSECNFTQMNEITLIFGPETRGLPTGILESFEPGNTLKIPMQSASRSLNLSNAVAIIVYEILRQRGFEI